ncbi:hypothetical protein WV31_10290 [Magnetospirillum sp. ME-1]|uniref:hypothetical protein n=1 Tax=Magnetospirillum sp. ME-1 TaxID=1639348 RepID=UPI000A17A2EB|nr:hypothetical protein [Magnetospirillum sp. ME-1]ARJ66015.1 hypothetical protein WV31_10290 [Magnetospirillum sp. ME-1]
MPHQHEEDRIDYDRLLAELNQLDAAGGAETIADRFRAMAFLSRGSAVEDRARAAATDTLSVRDRFGVLVHRFRFPDGSVLAMPAHEEPVDWNANPINPGPWHTDAA